MELFELLSALVGVHGPSGREDAAARAIAEYGRPFADELRTDVMGNLLLHKKGTGPRLMLAAHMDTVGLAVTYLEKDGSVRFGKLGGIQPEELRGAPVRFANGAAGAVKVHGKAGDRKLSVDDLYLDVGAKSEEEASQMVHIGDTAVFAGQPQRAGRRVISPYLDNRIACAMLLQVLERVRSDRNDLWFVFTAQEELGHRGAKTAAYDLSPDYAVAVDVTGAYDWPGAAKTGSAALGKGAAIKVMDASVICHPKMVDHLTGLACKGNIPYQIDVLTRGGTDAGDIYKSRSGVVTGGVCVPCRYIHTPTEVADLNDAEAGVKLLTALAENECSL